VPPRKNLGRHHCIRCSLSFAGAPQTSWTDQRSYRWTFSLDSLLRSKNTWRKSEARWPIFWAEKKNIKRIYSVTLRTKLSKCPSFTEFLWRLLFFKFLAFTRRYPRFFKTSRIFQYRNNGWPKGPPQWSRIFSVGPENVTRHFKLAEMNYRIWISSVPRWSLVLLSGLADIRHYVRTTSCDGSILSGNSLSDSTWTLL